MENDKTGSTGQPDAPRNGGIQDQAIPSDERIGTLIFAAFLTLFGLFWIFEASDLPSRQQTAFLSQGFLPITAGILLAILSALLFISTWRTPSRSPADLGRERLFEPKAELRGGAVFLILLAYILVLPHIHYLLSTFLLMLGGLYLARERFGIRLFVIAAAMAAIFFAIFVWGLGVPLPGSQFG